MVLAFATLEVLAFTLKPAYKHVTLKPFKVSLFFLLVLSITHSNVAFLVLHVVHCWSDWVLFQQISFGLGESVTWGDSSFMLWIIAIFVLTVIY